MASSLTDLDDDCVKCIFDHPLQMDVPNEPRSGTHPSEDNYRKHDGFQSLIQLSATCSNFRILAEPFVFRSLRLRLRYPSAHDAVGRLQAPAVQRFLQSLTFTIWVPRSLRLFKRRHLLERTANEGRRRNIHDENATGALRSTQSQIRPQGCDEELSLALASLKALKTLDIAALNLNSKLPRALPHVTELRVRLCNAWLATHCPKLESLVMTECTCLPEQAVEHWTRMGGIVALIKGLKHIGLPAPDLPVIVNAATRLVERPLKWPNISPTIRHVTSLSLQPKFFYDMLLTLPKLASALSASPCLEILRLPIFKRLLTTDLFPMVLDEPHIDMYTRYRIMEHLSRPTDLPDVFCAEHIARTVFDGCESLKKIEFSSVQLEADNMGCLRVAEAGSRNQDRRVTCVTWAGGAYCGCDSDNCSMCGKGWTVAIWEQSRMGQGYRRFLGLSG